MPLHAQREAARVDLDAFDEAVRRYADRDQLPKRERRLPGDAAS